MADKSCPGDCLRCSMPQQIYCAAQRSHAMMENQRSFAERLERIEAKLDQLAAPANLIPLKGKTQKAGGVDNRPEEPS